MRYYFLTFQTQQDYTFADETNTVKCHRIMVVRWANRWAWVSVNKSVSNAFSPTPPASSLSSAASDCCELTSELMFERYIEQYFTRHDLRVLNLQMTEMTPAQRKFITSRDGYAYIDRAYSMFYQVLIGQKERMIYALRTKMRARYYDNEPTAYPISYRDRRMSGYEYRNAKTACKKLDALVKLAIQSECADDLDEYFVDGECSSSCMNPTRVHERIKSSLDRHSIYMNSVYCDCGHFEYGDNMHDIRGNTWCDQCFDDNAVYVEDLDEYWPRDDAYWSDNDDAYYSYDRDEDDADTDSLMEYSTNVLNHLDKDSSIKSSPHGEFLMGIEFEMITEGHTSKAVTDVRDQLGESYCVCKYDGSLDSGGLEIVTAPRGLPEHIKRFKGWDVNKSYRAWDRKCCGMHIHIDSGAFTKMTLGKFIMFINDSNNMEFIRKIAGRHPERDEQARSYAAAEHQDVLINPSKALKGKSFERYRMINLQNLSLKESKRLGFGDRFDEGRYNTVELRIFRASLRKERLLAQIEFTHASVMFCRVASWRELNQSNFIKWLKGSAQGLYPHLADWYGVRRRTPVCNDGKQAVCEDQVEATTEGD